VKKRSGFVSNSSSSSFVVYKQRLNEEQRKIVNNYTLLVPLLYNSNVEDLGFISCVKDWHVVDLHDRYEFNTCMDNFDLAGFFRQYLIKVDDYEKD
jgi:hypothetical protein